MNNDRIQGRWKQLKGKVREQWGRLTDDDLDVIDGRRVQLLGRIQQRHGVASEEGTLPVSTGGSHAADVRFGDGGETVDNSAHARANRSTAPR